MIILSLLSVLLWFGGYLLTAQFMSTTGVSSQKDEKIITPPNWLYYLCGAPVSKNYPRGAMRVYAFHSQIQGISLVIYLIWYVISRPATLLNVVGFILCVLFPYLITNYVSKRYVVDY